MRVLVIDDQRVMRREGVTYARTVEEAEQLLEQEWDEVWFDFDMGYGQDMRVLARKITFNETVIPEHTMVYIHTSSPVGKEVLGHVFQDRANVVVVPVYMLPVYFGA